MARCRSCKKEALAACADCQERWNHTMLDALDGLYRSVVLLLVRHEEVEAKKELAVAGDLIEELRNGLKSSP